MNNNYLDKVQRFSNATLETMSLGELYSLANSISKDILINYYGEEDKIKFPLDIRGIVDKEERINVINVDHFYSFEDMYAYMSHNFTIFLNAKKTEQEKRFALAKIFCIYISVSDSDKDKIGLREGGIELTCRGGRLKKEITDWKVEILLAFLLFPCKLLKNSYEGYVKEYEPRDKDRMNTFAFMRYTTQNAYLPPFECISLINIVQNFITFSDF